MLLFGFVYIINQQSAKVLYIYVFAVWLEEEVDGKNYKQQTRSLASKTFWPIVHFVTRSLHQSKFCQFVYNGQYVYWN